MLESILSLKDWYEKSFLKDYNRDYKYKNVKKDARMGLFHIYNAPNLF